MKIICLFLCGLAMELVYLGFYVLSSPADEVLLLVGSGLFSSFLLVLIVWKSGLCFPGHNSPVPISDNKHIFWIIGFGILFRLTLIFHPPVGSDDIYRYLWDGKVSAHGVNPYSYAPADTALRYLHSEELPALVNHPTMHSIYPPLAQLFFHLSYSLFGESYVGLKFLLVLADVLSILLIVAVLRVSVDSNVPDLGSLLVVLYAWLPLPILYFGLDGHIDALGIPFLLLAIYLSKRSKLVSGAVALAFGGLAKLYPLIVVPFLVSIRNPARSALIVSVVLIFIGAGYALYWEPSGGGFDSLRTFSSEFAFNGSLFKLFYLVAGTNHLAHLMSAALLLIWLAFVYFQQSEFVEKCFLALVGFIALSPVVHPWYLTWIAALLSVRWSLSVFVFLALSFISNLTVYHYKLTGVWQEYSANLLLQYMPSYSLLIWEFFRLRAKRPKRQSS